jgi:hypothetical protein
MLERRQQGRVLNAVKGTANINLEEVHRELPFGTAEQEELACLDHIMALASLSETVLPFRQRSPAQLLKHQQETTDVDSLHRVAQSDGSEFFQHAPLTLWHEPDGHVPPRRDLLCGLRVGTCGE